MPLRALLINDYDTSQLGLDVEKVEGLDDGLTALDRTTQLPGRVGAVILAPEAETAPRTVSLAGVIRRSSRAALRRAVEELKDRLTRGTVEVRFVDDETRVLYARCQRMNAPAMPYQFANPAQRVAVDLFCPDPLLYAAQGTVVGFSTAKAQVPLGTAVSAPTIRIHGPTGGAFTITYRDARGVARTTMTLSVALSSAEYIEINCELATITYYGSGSAANGMSYWTAGDFPVLDPQDADFVNNLWPTLEVSGGIGEALYRKAYL